MPEVKPCFCGNENLTICCPFCKEPHPIDDWNKIYPFKPSPPATLVPLDENDIIYFIRGLATCIIHYHDKENSYTNEQVVHEARFKELAQAICQRYGQPRRGEEK